MSATDTGDLEQGSQGSNGKGPHESRSIRKRSPASAMIEDFSPVWFAICMNSGILAIICHQLPYQFNGLSTIATIFYLIDLVLFIIFTVIFCLRLVLHCSSAIREFGSNVEQLAYLACWPIAWLTLSANTALIVSTSSWGAHAFTIVAYIMWWFGALWTFVTSIVVYYTLFRNQMINMNSIAPGIIVPAVGVSTVASTGGLIAEYAYQISPGLQIPIIIFGYIVLGQGIFLALMVYAALIQKYLTTGFPPGAKLPGLILLLGPTGQCSTALQVLSGAADNSGGFAGYNKGTFLVASSASSLAAASIMFSLLLFGFGVFLLVIAVCAILEGAFRRELSWSMMWWSTIFPLGTMNTAMLVYAVEMDSPAWRVLTAGLLVFLVVNYLVNWGFTIYNVVWGALLVPADARNLSHAKVP